MITLTDAEKKAARDAADAIEAAGWCQNTAWTGDGRICVSEAIRRMLWEGAALEHYWNICEAIVGTRGGLFTWNDAKDQTKEKVVAKLREIGGTDVG